MSAARSDTWMPFYIGDYLADTMHLTRDQHGAYVLLIFAYWRRGSQLPDDDAQLAAIARATLAEWRRLRIVIAPFFQISGGLWRHNRIEREIKRSESIQKKRSISGANGAAIRWEGHGKTNGKRIASAMANASQIDAPSRGEGEGTFQEVGVVRGEALEGADEW